MSRAPPANLATRGSDGQSSWMLWLPLVHIQIAYHFKGTQVFARPQPKIRERNSVSLDLAGIKGQERAKRALEGCRLLPRWEKAVVRLPRGPATFRQSVMPEMDGLEAARRIRPP